MLISSLYTAQSLTIVHLTDGKVYTDILQSSHVNWKGVIKAYKAKDYNTMINLINVPRMISIKSAGRFSVQNGEVCYNGENVCGYLFDKIISNLKENIPFDNLLNFANNLWQNPSNRARQSFYPFLEKRNFTIDDDGMVLGWKTVDSRYYSINGNPDVKLIRGKMDKGGHVYNAVGEAIEMDRGEVDDDLTHCSHKGLHVASRSFAQNFHSGGHLMVIRFNPRDVVVVPTSDPEKVRVCLYEVIAEEGYGTKGTEDDSYDKPVPYHNKRNAIGQFVKS